MRQDSGKISQPFACKKHILYLRAAFHRGDWLPRGHVLRGPSNFGFRKL